MLLIKPVPGEFYHYADNRLCQVIAVAKDAQNLNDVVVYQELDGRFQIYVCALSQFDMSRKVEFQDEDRDLLGSARRKHVEQREGSGKREMSEVLGEFLDLQTKSDKILYMEHHKQEMTSSILCSIAHSLDFLEKETDLELRFYDIVRYLRTLQRYENNRLR